MSWSLKPHIARMIMIKKNASVLIMLLGMAIPLIAAEDEGCGDSGGEPCTANADCPAGFICDTDINECAETCASAADCAADEVCEPAQGGGGNLCYVNEDNNNNNNTPAECNDAELDCPDDGNDYVCDEQKKCEVIADPADIIQYIVIEDVTTVASACANSSKDPGSDIYFVRVLGTDGEPEGYGNVSGVPVVGEGDGNENISFGTIDGNAPPFRAGGDQCPAADFADSGIYSMGCRGSILLNFLDDGGNPVTLESGMTIEVGEYGATCGGSADDEYVVKVCTDSLDAAGGSYTSCTSVLGDASGFGTFQLSL